MGMLPFDALEPETQEFDETQDTAAMVAVVKDRKIAAAMIFLRKALASGPRPAKEVEAEAIAAGHAHTTIYKARARAYIRSERRGNQWIWSTAPQRKAARLAVKIPTSRNLETEGENLGALTLSQ